MKKFKRARDFIKLFVTFQCFLDMSKPLSFSLTLLLATSRQSLHYLQSLFILVILVVVSYLFSLVVSNVSV